jgi:hypothetical protein
MFEPIGLHFWQVDWEYAVDPKRNAGRRVKIIWQVRLALLRRLKESLDSLQFIDSKLGGCGFYKLAE